MNPFISWGFPSYFSLSFPTSFRIFFCVMLYDFATNSWAQMGEGLIPRLLTVFTEKAAGAYPSDPLHPGTNKIMDLSDPQQISKQRGGFFLMHQR